MLRPKPIALARSLAGFALLAISNVGIAQPPAAPPSAIVPEARSSDWWTARHQEKLVEARARGSESRLLFLGDSITHHWDEGIWAKRFGKYQPFNLGFSGDRTEHVLWRIQDGALDGLSPELAVVMIGTNNTGQAEGDPPEETLRGIGLILDEMRARLPDTKIVLHAIFPRDASPDGPKRQVNEEINAALPELAAAKGVEFMNINRSFLEKDGTLPLYLMPDLLHPNEAGYRIWADAIEPTLQRTLDAPKAAAQQPVELSLWPSGAPAPHDSSLVESGKSDGSTLRLTDIAEPSITFYAARQRGPRPTVLVYPGGGYSILSWDKEGTEIAEWLNTFGFSAAVLKYRVPNNREGALQDAQRAIGVLRRNAQEWNLDPNRIGCLGFSAGGHLAAALCSSWRQRTYPAVDAADALSCRPDFAALVYPAYLADDDLTLAKEITVDAQTPPTFIVQTQDDTKYVASAVAYYTALFRQGIPAELHLYPEGGHGYGQRPSAYPVSRWGDLCQAWLLNR